MKSLLFLALAALGMAPRPATAPDATTPPAQVAVTNLVVSTSEPLKPGPHGVVCLVDGDLTPAQLDADPNWTNPNVEGFMVREEWQLIEPVKNGFNFALFVEAANLAKAHGKFVGLSVGAGEYSPAWLYTQGAKRFPFTTANGKSSLVMPEPWDPVMRQYFSAMLTALGNAFDSNPSVAYVAMTGPGRDYEMGYVAQPADVATFDQMNGQELWGSAAVQIARDYAAAFPHTHLVYYMAPPTPDAEGKTTVTAAAQTLFNLVPQFGVACSSLSPTTDPTLPSVSFIQLESPTFCCGFQMMLPVAPTPAGISMASASGTASVSVLSASLVKASTLGAHYVEVYSKDCADPAEQATLQGAKLPGP